MFGHRWERTRATVIASQQMDDKPVYTHHGGGTLRRRQEYVLDVRPPGGGPVFRTTVLSPLDVDSLRDLSVGEVVPVLYKARSKKVKFDTSDPSMSHEAAKTAQRARFEEIAHAAPGSGPGADQASADGSERRRPDLSRDALLRQAAERLDRLQQLADLHARGVLNEAEFEAEKAKLLGSA